MRSYPLNANIYSDDFRLLVIDRMLSERQKTGSRTRTSRTKTARFDPRSLFGDPVSPKQAVFLNLSCEEALYGGAAGGGKSSGLLMAALQYVDVPHYAALILRRTYSDLSQPGAIMDRSHLWLNSTAARWNQNEKKWTFPSGAVLKFGFCDTEKDVENYKSAEFQFIGVDEASELSESMVTYMFSRLRRPKGFPVPLRMRLCSNPCPWLKERYQVPRGFREGIFWTIPGQRAFVPATLWDNPGLDQEAYYETLGRLSPVLRLQLREGDWDVRPEGKLFKREWFEIVEAGPA